MTLKGTHFEIEVKPEDYVADVKKNIESVRGKMSTPLHNICLSIRAQPAGSTDQARQTITAPQATAASAGPPQSASESAPILPLCLLLLASNLVAGSNLEVTVQQILDMGVGSWDRDTVVRSLHAAYNNPERAVEYLYSGILDQAEIPPVALHPPLLPVDRLSVLFPQGLANVGSNAGAGNLDFLHNSPQFQALRAMVQAYPQILQPMLQELGEGNALGQTAAGAVPQAVTVTPEEREAIERLEAMGFYRALVLKVYFACNKNEELAANYLLDHMHEFDE
ncbi:hypothetical protein K7X08_018449 [Anisodus acutangulus]|uniref:Ubiquitin receptor RAD23 n=1 Tax=Anisodus acutangulus TaxID=402998 RepID=A0A9Q1RAF7_9SOLA|nr:hypothetical protein K7X08_018449 [Anisodus acutangulus]